MLPDAETAPWKWISTDSTWKLALAIYFERFLFLLKDAFESLKFHSIPCQKKNFQKYGYSLCVSLKN